MAKRQVAAVLAGAMLCTGMLTAMPVHADETPSPAPITEPTAEPTTVKTTAPSAPTSPVTTQAPPPATADAPAASTSPAAPATSTSTSAAAPAKPVEQKVAVDSSIADQISAQQKTAERALQDQAVLDAQAKLAALQADANRAQAELQKSRNAQSEAQADYDLTTADLEDQRKLVDELRVQVGRIAVAARQQAASMGAASLLFNSDSEDSFISDMKVMQSVSAITDEQLARFASEQERLSDLEATQRESLDKVNSEVAEQKKLSDEYESKAAAAKAIVDSLTAAQRESLEALASKAVLDANQELFNSAIAEGASRVSRNGSFDASGIGLRPTSGPVTSPFGYRVNPIGGHSELHDGLDIAPPCGTAVIASWSGVVLSARAEGGWGNRVIIDSGTYKAAYNHLQSFNVRPGQVVEAGQVIASVGTTGYSTGCHLHFSTWVNGQITNPVGLVG